MLDANYWRALCPQLHVSDAAFSTKAARAVFNFVDDPDTVYAPPHLPAPELQGCFLRDRFCDPRDELRFGMDRDGYVAMPAGEKLPWLVDLEALSSGVKALIDAGWPPMMLTVYDECWAMSHQLKELLFLTSGNRQIGDWSIFYVDPAKSGAGWLPHRDRGTDASAAAFRNDGTAKYCELQ